MLFLSLLIITSGLLEYSDMNEVWWSQYVQMCDKHPKVSFWKRKSICNKNNNVPARSFPAEVWSAATHCRSSFKKPLQSNSVSTQACGSLASQVRKAAGASAPVGYFKIKSSQEQIEGPLFTSRVCGQREGRSSDVNGHCLKPRSSNLFIQMRSDVWGTELD